MQIDLLIAGGLVVTMDPDRRVIPEGAIGVTGDRIVMVGPETEVTARMSVRRRLDARKKIVLPGLIDAHAHGGHTLFKTIGAHLPSREWLRLMGDTYFNATTPEFWFADGRLAALERARFGITCGVMMLGNEPRTDGPEYGEAFARGSASVGTRTIVSLGPPNPPWPKKFTRWEGNHAHPYDATYERCMGVTEELTRNLHETANGRIRVMVGPSYLSVPAPGIAVEPEYLRYAERMAGEVRALADRHRLFIHTHAYGGEIEYVARHFNRFLGPDVLLAHCTGLTEREVQILAESDVKVAHCPKAHRAYAARCPVPELIDVGVTVAVASDASAPDRTFELFEAMRAAQRLQRVHFRDPTVLPPGKMLETVTIDAARAVGLGEEIGSLEVGKKADMIVIDQWRPHLVPTLMPIWQLVMGATGQDVTHVFVGGRAVIADGRCVTVDENEVLGAADEEAQRMVERAGLTAMTALVPLFWGHSRGGGK